MIKHLSCLIWVVFAFLGWGAAAQPKMTLSTDGTGQVLHYPYYTVLGRFDTYVSIVNTTNVTKAVRVRFLDSKNGRVTLEFNLFMSPFDVWAGALTLDAPSGGARLLSRDTSCTVPSIPPGGLLMQPDRFDEREDGVIIDNSFSRTAQGFIEVIEMGVATNSEVIAGTTHVNGVPRNCALMRGTLYTENQAALQPAAANAFTPPTGGLSGTGALINVPQGVNFSYDAVALDNVFLSAQHDLPGQVKPSFNDAQREVILIDKGRMFSAAYLESFDAVSSLYQRANASNEWITDPAIGAQTDLVFSFPTRRAYTGRCGIDAFTPFLNNGFCSNGAPERIEITAYDREEGTASTELDFCTLPPGGGRPTLDCTVGVYSIAGSNIFSLPNPKRFTPVVGTAGWIKFSFDVSPDRVISSLNGAKRDGDACGTLSLRGLPVIGFGVQKYVNGNVDGVLSNYGGSFVHKYERSIECK
jgi:hypothetical protein